MKMFANMQLLPRMAAFVEIGNEFMSDAVLMEGGTNLTGGLTFRF